MQKKPILAKHSFYNIILNIVSLKFFIILRKYAIFLRK
jgi:hypothetical protein